MNHDEAGRGEEFHAVVAVRNRVKRILHDAFEPEKLSRVLTVDRIGGAGESGGAKRRTVHAVPKVKHAFVVALEHFDVGEHVVTEGDRLRDLHVGEARHHRVGLLLRHAHEHLLQFIQLRDDAVDFVPEVETEVSRDLVVTGASGVETLAGVADQGRQTGFDIEMHVFEGELPLELASGNFLTDLLHAAADIGEILFGNHTGLFQHGSVGERTIDIGFRHPFIEIHRSGISQHEVCDRFGEAARPGLVFRVQRIRRVVRICHDQRH